MSTTASNSLIRTLSTCIIGGGNSAHVLVPFLAEAGHHVSILTRRPEEWSEVTTCEITDAKTGEVTHTHTGALSRKSSDPAEVIPGADVVILCMPVHQYRPALDRIAPHLSKDKDVFVGTIFGQAGFNWMVEQMIRDHGLRNKEGKTNIVAFALGQIPWICRTIDYGRSCANYGGKKVNTVAVSPADRFKKLEDIFLNDISLRPMNIGKFHLSDFLSLTLSVDDQIIHPARCYGLWMAGSEGKWKDEKSVPFFYADFDQASADNIRRLDDECTVVRDALRKRFPDRPFTYMLSYMDLEKLNHGSSHGDILASLRDSPQLAAIKTPTVLGHDGQYHLNHHCRFFTDDIPYGLLIAKWFAVAVGIETPFLDGVITWAQTLRGENFLGPGGQINKDYCLSSKYMSGIPESYGLHKLEEVLD